MSKVIIHVHGATKDAAPFRKPNFSVGDIAIGGTVIYKEGSGWRMSKAVSTSGMSIKLATGKTISVGDVWSTDASDWNAFRNATSDAAPCGCKNKAKDAETQKVKVTFWPRGSTQTMSIDVPKGTRVNEAIALAKKQIPPGSTFVSVGF